MMKRMLLSISFIIVEKVVGKEKKSIIKTLNMLWEVSPYFVFNPQKTFHRNFQWITSGIFSSHYLLEYLANHC